MKPFFRNFFENTATVQVPLLFSNKLLQFSVLGTSVPCDPRLRTIFSSATLCHDSALPFVLAYTILKLIDAIVLQGSKYLPIYFISTCQMF